MAEIAANTAPVPGRWGVRTASLCGPLSTGGQQPNGTGDRVYDTLGLNRYQQHLMPDFLIIGAQKCGTTSLYNYLIEHPQIVPAAQKEIHFFDFNFSKGVDWYLAQFPPVAPGVTQLSGEASPYYIFHPLVPKRVNKLFPQVKLILLLRDPVVRAWSHYHHEVRLGVEQLLFEDAIASEAERLHGEIEKMLADETYYSFNHQHYTYLSRGIYVQQLKTWMELFPPEQFLILKSEDFYANPSATVAQTLAFLELPPSDIKDYHRYNAGDYANLPDATRKDLANYFMPHNQQLSEYLKVDFSWSGAISFSPNPPGTEVPQRVAKVG